jgi:hypothetical protein
MPLETQQAVDWALTQTVQVDYGYMVVEEQLTKDMSNELVGKVRDYFNENNIQYPSFSYDDLKPYLV